jgi:hypothetical protein
MSRLTRLEYKWIKADAQYFRDENFINNSTYLRVLSWLDGGDDSEAQNIVVSWMESDAKWMRCVEPAAMAHFWYFALVIKVGSNLMRGILLSRASKLKGVTRRNDKVL